MNSITLYHFKSDDIKIDIKARFEGESLIIDGYDIGKRVEDYWGDSDYEYMVTIPETSVATLYSLLNVTVNNKADLLNQLAARYNSNFCYSEIRKLLDDNKIPYEGFTWT